MRNPSIVILPLLLAASAAAGEIHDAATNGDVAAVRRLLQADPALLNARDDQELTPLHHAASGGHREVLELLIRRGAEVNALSRYGSTPLIHARAGRKELVDLLLAAGADPRAKADGGYTALHRAVQGGSVATVELLLSKGLDVNAVASGPEGAPLHWAALTGRMEMVALLLRKGADVNVRNTQRLTPLHSIMRSRTPETARRIAVMLLNAGAALNPIDDRGETPLHYAAYAGREDVVRLLLDRGANPNGDRLRRPPLHAVFENWGAGATHLRIAGMLLDRGADVNAGEGTGATPLHMAARTGFAAGADLLLRRGAHVNARTTHLLKTRAPSPERLTVLHVAVEGRSLDLVRLLLDHGADVNAGDTFKRTPLHLAARRGDGEILSLLLGRGAAVNARASLDRPWLRDATPLHAAAASGSRAAVEVLLARGAGINDRTASGETALQIAVKHGHTLAADFLRSRGAQE